LQHGLVNTGNGYGPAAAPRRKRAREPTADAEADADAQAEAGAPAKKRKAPPPPKPPKPPLSAFAARCTLEKRVGAKESYRLGQLLLLGSAVEPYEGERGVKDTEGTSCHFCRQKMRGLFTRCATCDAPAGSWCGGCLRTRMGENVEEALADAAWSCPECRGTCNCSSPNCLRLGMYDLPSTGDTSAEVCALGFPSTAHYLITQLQKGGPVAWPLTAAVRAAAEADAPAAAAALAADRAAWAARKAADAAAVVATREANKARTAARNAAKSARAAAAKRAKPAPAAKPASPKPAAPKPAAAKPRAPPPPPLAPPPPRAPRPPHAPPPGSLVGTTLRKRFGRRVFVGDIVSYDHTTGWYKIMYPDGDAEDMDDAELAEALAELPQQQQTQQRAQAQGTLALHARKPGLVAAAKPK
jgi:hypothetical protein